MLPWLAIALPGAAIALGIVAFSAVVITKTRFKIDKDFSSKFKFLRILGQGSFGRVYKVKSRKDGRRYALKILELANAKVKFSAVLSEIDLMKSLEHPNIIKYISAYQSGSRVAIQMQFCQRGDLRRYIKTCKGHKLARWRVYTWMVELTSAVEYIHSMNVMHRDLKPENILLNQTSSLLLADFGIARILTSGYASSYNGTKCFMAPEALQGRYDKKADIYSLGCVFLCLVCMQTVPRKIPDLWNAVLSLYGETIFNVIDSCTSLNKNGRPTAEELYEQLCETEQQSE